MFAACVHVGLCCCQPLRITDCTCEQSGSVWSKRGSVDVPQLEAERERERVEERKKREEKERLRDEREAQRRERERAYARASTRERAHAAQHQVR